MQGMVTHHIRKQHARHQGSKTMNYRSTKFYKKLNSYLAAAYAEGFCEGEDATEREQLTAWQWLVDTGQAWRLQGWLGRTATYLIDQGLIKKTGVSSPGGVGAV